MDTDTHGLNQIYPVCIRVNLWLTFVSKLLQQFDTRLDVRFGFDALRRTAIDDAQHAAALLRFRDNHF